MQFSLPQASVPPWLPRQSADILIRLIQPLSTSKIQVVDERRGRTLAVAPVVFSDGWYPCHELQDSAALQHRDCNDCSAVTAAGTYVFSDTPAAARLCGNCPRDDCADCYARTDAAALGATLVMGRRCCARNWHRAKGAVWRRPSAARLGAAFCDGPPLTFVMATA